MARALWKERIVVDPDIHHGAACIKGTRIPVATILGSLADGMTAEEVIDAYPQLKPEDIAAVLAYAAEVVREEFLLPLSACSVTVATPSGVRIRRKIGQ